MISALLLILEMSFLYLTVVKLAEYSYITVIVALLLSVLAFIHIDLHKHHVRSDLTDTLPRNDQFILSSKKAKGQMGKETYVNKVDLTIS